MIESETFKDTYGNIHNTKDITGIELVQNFSSATQIKVLNVHTLKEEDVELELEGQEEFYVNIEIKSNEWVIVDNDSSFIDELLEEYHNRSV